MKSTLTQQRGATLLVSLIMLVLITLLAVTSFKLSKGNLQVVGNMQQRNQALTAAQGAVEKVISSPQFTTTPNISNTTYVSVNGSSTNDIKVVTTPTCISTIAIPASALNLSDSDDAGCVLGNTQQFGVEGVANTPSTLCSNALWDINSVATDVTSNAQVSVNQGTAVRVVSTATCP